MKDIHHFIETLRDLNQFEWKAWLGTCATSVLTVLSFNEVEIVHHVLVGIGAFSTGLATAYYYIMKAILIRKEILLAEKKLFNETQGRIQP